MTSILPAPSSDFKPVLSVARHKTIMNQVQEPSSPQTIKQEPDIERGRPRSRSREKDSRMSSDDHDRDADGDVDVKNDNSSNSDGGPTRKRRRSRKGLDKKFECPNEGCGKSYSRAEHLYRHQLNHNPKNIYKCHLCNRTFVRQDLCNRHKDRHTAKGSTLSRKDSISSHTMSNVDSPRASYSGTAPPGSTSPEANRSGAGYSKYHNNHLQYQSPKDVNGSPYTPITATPPAGFPHSAPPNGIEGYMHQETRYPNGSGPRHSQQSPSRPPHPTAQTNVAPYGVLSPVSTQHGSYHSQPTNTPQSTTTLPYVSQQNFPPFTLPPSEFAITSPANSAGVSRESGQQQTYAPAASGEYNDQPQPQASGEMMLLDQMGAQTTIPVFGSDGVLNKSPYISIPEDFVAFLFNTTDPNSSPTMGHMMPQGQYSHYGDYQSQYSMPYYGTDGVALGYFPPSNQPQKVMSVTNLLDQHLPESLLSEEKSQEIFDFIKERFHENDHAPVKRQRDNILEGDRSDENHLLSRKMMQAYIGSYWLHFSDQVPILHKPTFSPDKTPNLQLIALMAIGASCHDRSHGQKVTRAGANLSDFLAWHLRWEIFMDFNFRPPAKLWIFQTLLLLEVYEKMYSTRELHERAHIHHATTITLMRRGRSLIGKSALDSPPNPRDDKQGMNGSRHSSTSGLAHTPDEWWNHWITNETTRRAAFAAFLIDSTHATMFGHSTVMVAHEMRLPLPCDEQLWKASSGAEVGRIEANLMSNGIKPVSFLEGLKRTLAGQEVQTNSFGRQILMAGLLSVSWHMNQRDLQVSSLGGGMSQALGGRDKWRSTLTRAFDSWKTDFDKSLQRAEPMTDPYSYEKRIEDSVVFESRNVLHHLAHMAMHVDIVDCQIFARAKRLLGRAIGTQDLNSAQRRMKDNWAPSAKARDATFYALKFLSSVLLTEETGSPGSDGYSQTGVPYSARDDVLLNRPWVLYFAALVVWCYGFALEGPSGAQVPIPTSDHEKIDQMREYLQKLGSVPSPGDLKLVKGVNNNSAMLMVLKDSFESTRWELLHEGAALLTNCIQLNSGATVV
ncbi:fungal-specific transcription factor domain-containing protein [Pseudomassariella vexata]|uniref:Fungal-specific transcription factor domain-domain-containing protein n=1 Tax=Pseudomassariella vexata TaxID=1141098 RepID=A0A1Y2E297_9PEZI|nr:fungal-specific transcription factor domain-containing protein [Pseudomassariella vexata]ORY65474.1 fungal-specific transcription factor domain-domain-containing protein [Pseudomassariella vexata]